MTDSAANTDIKFITVARITDHKIILTHADGSVKKAFVSEVKKNNKHNKIFDIVYERSSRDN